ncbi:hypothetical protein MMC2321_01225 [Chitinophaga sp. MM2321]
MQQGSFFGKKDKSRNDSRNPGAVQRAVHAPRFPAEGFTANQSGLDDTQQLFK